MLGPELRTGRNLGAGSVSLTDRYDQLEELWNEAVREGQEIIRQRQRERAAPPPPPSSRTTQRTCTVPLWIGRGGASTYAGSTTVPCEER